MRIRSSKNLISGAYHVQLGLDGGDGALTPREQEALSRFGEPVVDVGGDFTGAVSFTLDSRELRFPSQFPVKVVFQIAGDEDASDKARLWLEEIKTRIEIAMTAIVTQSAGSGNGEFVDTIDTTA